MDTTRVLIYDGSFNGFLTAVYVAFENNIEVMGFQRDQPEQKGLFMDNLIITTQKNKAKRIWESIEKKSHTAIRNIYFAFLSEADGVDFMLYQYIKKLYGKLVDPVMDQMALIEAKILKLVIQVDREKSYIESSLDFQTTYNSVRIAELDPVFNILPLISRHFRVRYSKHPWILFDRKRKYGIHYNSHSLEMINKETKESFLKTHTDYDPGIENSYRMAI